jgi:uncharacterized protein
VKFTDRLALLRPVVPSGTTDQPLSSEEEHAPESPTDPLAEVRAKLAQLTAAMKERNATPPARRGARSPDAPHHLGELPFVRVETEHGMISQRYEKLGESAQVGRHALRQASQADPQLLALLALDPRLADCLPKGALYFDTETTGLGGAGTLAFLVGLCWQDPEGNWVLEQLLLAHPSEEQALLRHLEARILSASFLVSFNGRSFDWPLLQSRRVMNQMEPLDVRPHLDLLHLARRVHKRRLERCRLVDLETEILGFARGEDDIAGADIAPIYGHFLRTGDEEALLRVVCHNAWDVMTMVALVGLYGQALSTEDLDDMYSTAQTLLRAKGFERVEVLAEAVMSRGAAAEGLRLRAESRRARGDIARALLDFEELAQGVQDAELYLTLAKLHEHHAHDFRRALEWAEKGTGEGEEASEKRQNRLLAKLARQGRQSKDGAPK